MATENAEGRRQKAEDRRQKKERQNIEDRGSECRIQNAVGQEVKADILENQDKNDQIGQC